ncbi:60S ribosomal protein L17, mitochondrial precursor [Scheffersomyces amazonensis]|uniref:60S ribosomal protein L17, mitochondrial precursor n=1 Tax=Scheffersomyces amazonensis TaxID=1078765 RepID=UPI00315DB318
MIGGLRRSAIRAYATKSSPIISSSLLLSRNPVVTADLDPFQSQFYKYQQELWRRLMWTFPKWFYFREGTLAEQRYRQLNRDPVAYNPDLEFPRGKPEIRHRRDRRFKQEIKLPKTYKLAEDLAEGETLPVVSKNDLARQIIPNSRITEADKVNDLTSLERKLSRTLYLIINQNGKWILPNFTEQSSEVPTALHKLAEDGLYQLGGEKINYFNVSNTPCHLHINQAENKKEFIIKSHILSGEFKPQDESLKYLWLTKEELKDKLDAKYYYEINHLFSDV